MVAGNDNFIFELNIVEEFKELMEILIFPMFGKVAYNNNEIVPA